MKQVLPVILAGGSGTRLWPLSRKSYPKQFGQLIGQNSLFQQSAMRFENADHIEFSPPVIVTNEDFRYIALEQLSEIKISHDTFIVEPTAKNTAPAVLAAAIHADRISQDPYLLVVPSDHLISDVTLFNKLLLRGISAADGGNLVTFGIEPTHAETGYGYLEVSGAKNDDVQMLSRFIEKPSLEVAEKMLDSDRYYWNSGIFLFRSSDILSAFQSHQPKMYETIEHAMANLKSDENFLRPDPVFWADCDSISIDYAIMENVNNLAVVPYSAEWTDLGGWNAVWQRTMSGTDQNALTENAHAIDCENVLLRSENKNQHIVGLGLKNLIAVAMPDAVLVADMQRSQQVRVAVDELKSKNIAQAEKFPKDHRPWGWYETLAISDRFQVKRIHVKPGAALSLQSHHHRSEHWVVVEGTAKVTVGDENKLVTEGESIYIPLGYRHRLENPGKIPMLLIEVQTGSYLGEDDITRFDDIYDRTQ